MCVGGMCLAVHTGKSLPQHGCGGQRATMGASPYFYLFIETVSLLAHEYLGILLPQSPISL